jgi:hypothetical protein
MERIQNGLDTARLTIFQMVSTALALTFSLSAFLFRIRIALKVSEIRVGLSGRAV